MLAFESLAFRISKNALTDEIADLYEMQQPEAFNDQNVRYLTSIVILALAR